MRNLFLILAILFLGSCGSSSSPKNADSTNNSSDISANLVSVIEFEVEGMTCEGCENTVKRKVGELEGITEVSASHTNKNALIKYNAEKVSADEIAAVIANAGYKVGKHTDRAPAE